MYFSQRMPYPVANHKRVRVIKNILREKSYKLQEKSYPVANHERVRVTKNILCGGSREHKRHKKSPILWQMM